jgi:hypothetical protein
METRPNQHRPTPDQERQPEHAESPRERTSNVLPVIKPGHGAEVYGRTGRKTRLLRRNHRLHDERKFSARDWRQEMSEEAQEDIIEKSQGFGGK